MSAQETDQHAQGTSTVQTRMQKTNAKEFYCLTEKDLEPLAFQEKANRRYKNATPTKLYSTEELERAAVEKWGSMPEVEAERNAREQKRLKRALEHAGPANDDTSKKHKLVPANDAAAAYDPSGSQDLPSWITERVRPCQRVTSPLTSHPHPQQQFSPHPDHAQTSQPEFILYWMRTAIRGHENPALDVAKHEAQQQGLPLLVAAFILTSHPYPTARRFKFWMEGLRDTQRELRAQGLELLIYLEGVTGISAADHHTAPCDRGQADTGTGLEAAAAGPSTGSAGVPGGPTLSDSQGWQELLSLVQRCSVVVTEDMPVDPEAHDLQALTGRAPAGVKGAAAGAEDHPDAEGASTSQGNNTQRMGHVPEGLGWQPLDLSPDDVDITQLLQQCRGIDHSVEGIQHTTGGSTAAYTRWEKFKLAGLNQYAAKRNNSMLRNAVSRQSAYHHFGMISPFKVARDLVRNSSNGSRKFFDEFMTWRELSYAFCFQHWPDLESMQALPEWSRSTLEAHKNDPRPHLMTDEQLDKGQTGDAIWDAAQYQLALTGELHNNIRMTWGKAILPWSADPDTAIKRTVFLNHKYALDGCDPCSYSGILWCYGFIANKINKSWGQKEDKEHEGAVNILHIVQAVWFQRSGLYSRYTK
ncbi:hypothetical protein WJX79_007045 [Trebouxia sp. C0005]